jgi:cytochrome c oxidase subunit 2
MRARVIVTSVVLVLLHTATANLQTIREVEISASRFKYEPSTIQVTAGERVRLIVRSGDGTHGFSIPKLKVDMRIPKGGQPVVLDLTAPAPGRYEIACSEFCGNGHGGMKAALVSVKAMAVPSTAQ